MNVVTLIVVKGRINLLVVLFILFLLPQASYANNHNAKACIKLFFGKKGDTVLTTVTDIKDDSLNSEIHIDGQTVSINFYRSSNRRYDRFLNDLWNLRELKIPAPIKLDNIANKWIIDVGSGDGALVIDLININKQLPIDKQFFIEGIDIAPSGNLSIIRKGDALNLPYKNSSIDIYHSWESVLAYAVMDPWADSVYHTIFKRALDEAIRVTKPGGLIMFSSRMSPQLTESIEGGINQKFDLIYPHFEDGSLIETHSLGSGVIRMILRKR